MSTTLDSQPSATTYDVERLVRLAWDGQIRIPHFQRDFRWNWEDMRKLFDSIVKGYPIGSLLLWRRPAKAQMVHLGNLTIDAPEISDALWVVDGQQRLTSLANALHPRGQVNPRFSIAYDLELEDFVRTPALENPFVVPLPVVFNLQELLKWFNRYPQTSEYVDIATAVTRKIRQFEVPAYLVTQDNPAILQDIFDRMNNYGKRLSRAEIFAALNAGDEDSQDSTLTFETIAERIDTELQFGKIDNETVLGAILARRGTEVRRDIRNEFSGDADEGRDAAYRAGEDALGLAVEFLQVHAGVPHISMLAYRYLLVTLARFFSFYPDPDVRSLRLLRRWYWQAAAAGPERFRGGTPNAARVLCARIYPGDVSSSIQGLLKAVRREHAPSLELRRFATNEASTKILLCAWWSLNPRNPTTADPYEQIDLAYSLAEQHTARDAVRYVVPKRAAPEAMRQWAANRALMPGLEVDGREVSALISYQPLDLSGIEWSAMLASHSITEGMAELARREQFDEFIVKRQEALEAQASSFLTTMTEWQFEDTPSLDSLILDEESDELD